MRSDQLLIQDIIEAAQRIDSYTSGITYDSFIASDMVKDAVVRNFEIIGEASGRLSDSLQQKHNSIEWRKLKAFRNLLIHQYFGVDYALVWDIIQNFMPTTLAQLQQIKAMEL